VTAALPRLRVPEPGTAGRFLLILGVAVAQFALAFGAILEPKLTIAAIVAGFCLIMALIKPVPMLVLAFGATFISYRVGPAALDMSVTDAATILGTVAAVPHVPWRDPRLRQIFFLLAFYLAMVSVSALREPSVTAFGEVGHRALMVVGALMIGSALARLGKAKLGLRAFLYVATFMSVVSIIYSVTSGFSPAYPFEFHKNAIGAHLATGVLIMLAGHNVVGFRKPVTLTVSAILLLGLLASQSRGAALGLVAAAALYLTRSRNVKLARAAPFVGLLALVLLTFAILSFNSSQEENANSRFNSYNSRIEDYTYAIDNAFKPHIPFGNGPKWFHIAGSSGPHNVIVAELSETGVMGTSLFLVFLIAVALSLWRLKSDLGDVAVLVGVERFLDTMLGIFWVAGTGTVPWLMAGLAYGESSDEPLDDDEATAEVDDAPAEVGHTR